MRIDADQLFEWSEALCTLPSLDLSAAAPALGLEGRLDEKTDDFVTLEPPPAGTTRVGLSRERWGVNKGKFSQLELQLDPALASALTQAELDGWFGAGTLGPRVSPDQPFVVTYRVERPGAGFRVLVHASFATEPSATSVAIKLALRREVVKAPAK